MVIGVDLTALNGSVVNQVLFRPDKSRTGLYRISWEATVLVPDAVSSTLGGINGFQVTYTDNVTGQRLTTPPPTATNPSATNTSNVSGAQASGSVQVDSAADSDITFSFDYLSNTPGLMSYALKVRCEYIG